MIANPTDKIFLFILILFQLLLPTIPTFILHQALDIKHFFVWNREIGRSEQTSFDHMLQIILEISTFITDYGSPMDILIEASKRSGPSSYIKEPFPSKHVSILRSFLRNLSNASFPAKEISSRYGSSTIPASPS